MPVSPDTSGIRAHEQAYLLKERVTQPGQLGDAVHAVAASGSVIDPLIVESMLTARGRR
jgi:DNA-binding NarL/FixJ family response regulator